MKITYKFLVVLFGIVGIIVSSSVRASEDVDSLQIVSIKEDEANVDIFVLWHARVNRAATIRAILGEANLLHVPVLAEFDLVSDFGDGELSKATINHAVLSKIGGFEPPVYEIVLRSRESAGGGSECTFIVRLPAAKVIQDRSYTKKCPERIKITLDVVDLSAGRERIRRVSSRWIQIARDSAGLHTVPELWIEPVDFSENN